MTKEEPLVSAVVPVWNTGGVASKLIERLLGQSYRNLEIIAVNDGSMDDSLSILQGLAKKDKRLKVIHQKNAGASAARNTGIKVASGKYIVFVDSDDDIVENYVEKLVRGMEARPGIVTAVIGFHTIRLNTGEEIDMYTQARRKQRKNETWADYILELIVLDGRMHSVLNKIFRRDVIQKYQIKFEEGRKFAEDLKFVLDYLEHASGEIEFILEPAYTYNFGTETSTVKTSSTIWRNWKKSHTDLRNWARSVSDGELRLKTRALLGLVYLRWRVSWCRARKRARC